MYSGTPQIRTPLGHNPSVLIKGVSVLISGVAHFLAIYIYTLFVSYSVILSLLCILS